MCKLYWGALAAAMLAAIPSRGIITNGSPNSSVTSGWDGVGLLQPQQAGYSDATGTLIDALHVLTAAHAVTDIGTTTPIGDNVMTFDLGSDVYDISSINVDPLYNPSTDLGDVAVLTLSKAMPATGHTTYAYNTSSLIADETAQQTTLVGYGVGGTGTSGEDATHYPAGQYKRAGINAVDQDTDYNASVPNINDPGTNETLAHGLLVFDFDNYSAGTNGPLGGPALGVAEADTTDGDSGGPMFEYDSALGQYVLVGITVSGEDDNPEYGDISWGTRVSDYSAWIASEVPEPTGLVPVAFGLVFGLKRRSKRI